MLFAVLLVLFFLLFATFAWRQLAWAVYLVILALPSFLVRFQIFSIPMTLLEGMVLILFVVWLVRNFKFQISNFKFSKDLVWPVVAFLLAVTISIFTAPELQAAAGIWKAYFVEPILFFIVFVNVIKTKEQIRRVILALGLSLIVPGLLAIYQKFTGALIPVEFWAAAETRRVTSFYGYPNAIGLYFAPIVTLLIGLFVKKVTSLFKKVKREKNKIATLPHGYIAGDDNVTLEQSNDDQNRQVKWLNIIILFFLILIGSLSILFATSKGAMLAVGIGILFYAIFWKGFRIWFAGLLILSVLTAYLLVPNLLSFEGSKTVAGGGSLEVRTEQWSEAWQMLSKRPILGAGLSGYQERVTPYHDKDYIEIYMYPHQLLLNFWSEIGLLGLLAFIWLIVIFFRKLFNIYQSRITDYGLPVAGAMVALLSHGLVDVPYFKNDLAVLFWIIFGLIIVIYQINKNKTTPPMMT